MTRLLAIALPVSLLACGSKPPAQKPVADEETKVETPHKETEEDRAAKRLEAAHALIPEGSTCLPTSLKGDEAAELQLAAIGADAIVCANDTDTSRLLGPIACWKVNLGDGSLEYKQPAPVPGRSLTIHLDDGCARGYCLPATAKIPDDGIVHIAWNLDGSKVAVLAGDDVHLFAAASRAHEQSFSIRGDKGVPNNPTAVHWVGDMLFVEGADEGPSAGVWAIKTDGSLVGPIEALGGKADQPLSTFGGSFSLLDKSSVGVAERGFTSLTTYEIETGKRTKIVRKLKKPPCKAAEIDAYWKQQHDNVRAKCKAALSKEFGYLVGATAVKGSTNFLVMLRGDRLGELAVLDAKTLSEKKAIQLPWCTGDEAAAADEAKDDAAADEAAPETRGPMKKGAARAEDPDQGGE
jgi:predicted small lipoprotein YifL